jgi:IS5 family transposase
MPKAMPRAKLRRSKLRSAVEHVFARQKDKMKLVIRTILWPAGDASIRREAAQAGKGEDRYGQIAYNTLSYVPLTAKPQARDKRWPKGRNACRGGGKSQS